MLCFEVTEIKTAFLYSEISTKVDFVSKYFIKSFSYCGGGGTRTEEPSVVSRMLSPLYYGYASLTYLFIKKKCLQGYTLRLEAQFKESGKVHQSTTTPTNLRP